MSKYYKDGDSIDVVAAGTEVMGRIIAVAGTVGIVNPTANSAAIVAGDLISVRIKGVVMVPNPNSVVVAAGGLVEYDYATDAVIAQAAGDYDIGHAVAAAVGATDLAVLLPGPAPVA